MLLTAGHTLTHYEILGPLGAGGMGEVYRAKDTRLQREVAIKVLPEHFADDEERLRRFEREAKTLASLNHPNVAGIHGIDQVGDTCFLAMELVEGEDLAQRLAHGALPVDEALDVCRQIAEGLEAAHEAGVVHRDVKPANVRITHEGVVKILDFGLAKPIRPKATREGTSTAQSDSFLVTEEGLVLGTPTYMSPEQARGKRVDRRTDVWAFGCVLYECLTGRRAFGGETFSDVVAAIVQGELDWSSLPADTPDHVVSLLRRCVDKDARTRLRDAGEARIALASEPVQLESSNAGANAGGRLVVGVVLGAIAASGAWWFATSDSDAGAPSERRPAVHSYDLAIDRTNGMPAISPDGTRVLFADDGLWVRDLAASEAELVVEADGRLDAGCWSPDGTAVAFFHGDRLETLVLDSARPEPRCVVPEGELQVNWGDDGSLLVEISGSTANERIFLLAPGSSELEHLAWLDFPDQLTPDRLWPQFLPGSEELLVTVQEDGGAWISVASLRDESLKRIVRASSRSAYVAPGWLAWLDVDRLVVQAFDPETHVLSGRPREIVRGVDGFVSRGDARFSFSNEGTLLVRPRTEKSRIEWVARGGRSLAPLAEPDYYESVQLDPRGERLAYTAENSETGSVDLWVRDLARGVSTRITSHDRWVRWPCWSPDGTRLAFLADWKGPPNVFVVDLDLREPVEIVPYDGSAHALSCWTAPGDAVVYGRRAVGGSYDLWLVELDGLARRPLIESPFAEFRATVTRRGDWIAYCSTETGQSEVYVARFPTIRDRTRASTDGGDYPLWNEDGTELYYQTEEGIFAASFDPAGPTIGTPELVVPDWGGNVIEFDVAPDGQRFVVRRSDRDTQRPMDRLITNWPRLLER